MKGRLFTRMLLFMLAAFGAVAAVSSLLSARELNEALSREYENRALAVARSIADGNTELLLGKDAGAIQAAIDLHQEMGGLSYILVTDARNEVVAHTFAPWVPKAVMDIAGLAGSLPDLAGRATIRHLALDDGTEVIHVVQPVLGGRAGHVHIGMGREPIRRVIAQAILRQQLLTLAVFLAFAAVALLFTRSITRPLSQLAAYAQRVAGHDFSSTCEVRGVGEIGALGEAMRSMSGQIAGHVTQLERTVAVATEDLQDALGSLSAIIGNIADGLLVVDGQGVILQHNPALVRMFGLDEDLPGQACAEVFGEAVCQAVLAGGRAAEGKSRLVDAWAIRPDGSGFPVEITVALVSLSSGEASVCILRDVTAARQAEREREQSRALLERMVAERTRELSRANTQLKIEVAERKVVGDALRRAEVKFRGIFENAVEGIYQLSPEGRYLAANPAMASIFGYATPEEFMAALNVVSPYADAERREAFFAALEEAGEVQGFESQVRRRSAEVIWISENARRVVDVSGATLYYEGFVGDITLRKEAESRLVHQAFHDALTGLPNRLLFMDHLRMAMDRSRRRADFRFAVLYMDLDRFKVINDSLGHDIGDRLLRHVAATLLSCGRSTDTVARFGGDEFAILLEDITAPRDAIAFSRRVLDEIAKPLDLDGREVITSGSMGIVLRTEDYERPEAVLRDADTAMYHAKAMGKSRFKVFNRRMHAHAQELLETEIELRRAVAHEELTLVFQPIIDIQARRLAGFETLVRWPRTGRGEMLPSEFIPLAEETGIIYPLDYWVFSQACCAVREFDRILDSRGPHLRRGFSTNINISAKHFRNPLLVGQLEQIMNTCGVDSTSITLEITESVLLDHVASARELAAKLRDLGLGLCIDDFGTGYSSLSYIQRFSVDAIKIDRTFLAGIGTEGPDQGGEAIVRTLVTLGSGLGLKVVAEGVENAAQLGVLHDLGCRYAQGYLFAPPLSEEEALSLVRSGAAESWPGFPESGWSA